MRPSKFASVELFARRIQGLKTIRYHTRVNPGGIPPGRISPGRRGARAVSLGLYGLMFASLGYFVAHFDLFHSLLPVAGRLGLDVNAWKTRDEHAVDQLVDQHPLTASLRQRREFTESRPHLEFSNYWRRHSLTANTLLGPDKIEVAPHVWRDDHGDKLVSIVFLGRSLCGYPGVVHGGLLATLLDEGLAQCCLRAFPKPVAVTAKLEINYRAPVPAGSFVVLRAKTIKVEGRKAWVRGHLETLPAPGTSPIILTEAEGLFITPKQGLAKLL